MGDRRMPRHMQGLGSLPHHLPLAATLPEVVPTRAEQTSSESAGRVRIRGLAAKCMHWQARAR
eukprot:3482422-Rhodomonas_salina.1